MSADIEAGYGPASFDVAESVEVVLDVGAVGVNIEDRRRDAKGPLFALAEQCERLGAARDAADRRIDAFTINARTDVYLGAVGEPDQREEMVLERARAYAEAGADCLFVPGLSDIEVIRALVRASPLPLNVLLSPGSGPSTRELANAGVRRISVGHLLAANAYAAVRTSTLALPTGDSAPLANTVPHPRMQELMSASSRAA